MINYQSHAVLNKQLIVVILSSIGLPLLLSNSALANNPKSEQGFNSVEKIEVNKGDDWHGGINFGTRVDDQQSAPVSVIKKVSSTDSVDAKKTDSINASNTDSINTSKPDLNSASKNTESRSENNWYGALDFGSNVLYASNGRSLATSTSGLQVTGKVGYSMNGPRIELESSIGTLASGAASFNGTGINAYYDFQTGSTRPYIGVGYGFGSTSVGGSSASEAILQSKLGLSFESTPGNNFYVELRGIQPTSTNSVGIASLNVGNTLRF
jgi:hypothetical protein